jgi:hypothetical protein
MKLALMVVAINVLPFVALYILTINLWRYAECDRIVAQRSPHFHPRRATYSPSGAPVGKTALTPDIVAADWRRMKGPYRRDPRGQDRQNALQQIGRFRAQITALKERQFAAGEPPRTEGEGEMSA